MSERDRGHCRLSFCQTPIPISESKFATLGAQLDISVPRFRISSLFMVGKIIIITIRDHVCCMVMAMHAGRNASRKEEEQWRRAPTNFNIYINAYMHCAIVFTNGIKMIIIHDFDCARFDYGISPMLLHRTIESAWYIYEHSATYMSERTLREHVFYIIHTSLQSCILPRKPCNRTTNKMFSFPRRFDGIGRESILTHYVSLQKWLRLYGWLWDGMKKKSFRLY